MTRKSERLTSQKKNNRLTGSERERVLQSFVDLRGIAEATAERLVDDLGITTLYGVHEASLDGRLAELPGVTPKHVREIRTDVEKRLNTRRFAEPRRTRSSGKKGAFWRAGYVLGLFVIAPIIGFFLLSLLLLVFAYALKVASTVGLANLLVGPLLAGFAWFGARYLSRKRSEVSEKVLSMVRWGSLAGLSFIGIFLWVSTNAVVSLVTRWIGGGSPELFGLVGMMGMLGLLSYLGYGVWGATRQHRQEKKRERNRPPAPPWENPLARTRPANLLLEALVDEYSLIGITILCGVSVALQTAFPALAGGGLLLIWLAIAPDLPWFRRRVDAKHLELAEEQARQRRHEQLQFIDWEQREQHHLMVKLVESVEASITASNAPIDTARFESLVDHHLWLMELEKHYAEQLEDFDRDELQDRREELQEQREDASSELREALDRQLDVVSRRLELNERVDERLLEITEKRRQLEDTLRLLAESALSASSPHAIAREVDDILAGVHDAEEVVLDFHSEEEELEREIEEAVAAASPRHQAT